MRNRPLPAATPPSVAFEAVTFTYPGRVAPAVRDLSFEIAAGETVAVVGRSGAGKTTLANLLLRFVAPQRGRILIGERDLTLSGGQRQRLASARALLKDAPILVLDEGPGGCPASADRVRGGFR